MLCNQGTPEKVCLEGEKELGACTGQAVALFVLVLVLASFSIILRPIMAKVNAFFLLQHAIAIRIGGASFYFFTDTHV